jgi:hypothetical protein
LFSNVAFNPVVPITAFLRKVVILVTYWYFKNDASLLNVVPGTAGRTHGVAIGDLGLWLVSCDLGLNRRERRYSFSNVAINAASILNVVPGTAGRTHGVAIGDLGLWLVSHALGLNRRERRYSFGNVA